MNLTDDIKEKLKNAKSEEEAKAIIDGAGIVLDDDDLDKVSAGGFNFKEWWHWLIYEKY